jgi:hypothetical protein
MERCKKVLWFKLFRLVLFTLAGVGTALTFGLLLLWLALNPIADNTAHWEFEHVMLLVFGVAAVLVVMQTLVWRWLMARESSQPYCYDCGRDVAWLHQARRHAKSELQFETAGELTIAG